MQRFFDIFFSSIALIVFSPLLLACCLVLKCTGEGEIFYSQKRTGLNQKNFNLLKFTTMVKNSENIGSGTVTLKNDPRVLPFGKFLRKTKLNELPQLLNVFFGDMSVIGPRPLAAKQFSFYDDDTKKIIGSVRPGLSGAGSVIFRDEEEILSGKDINHDEVYRTKITPLKANLETWYVENKSIFLYFKLIVLTIIVVLKKDINTKKYFKGVDFAE